MQNNYPEFYILPAVYIVPYPVPLPAWEQMQSAGAASEMQADMKKQFSLPYPEDDNEE
ncbi:MAG: hypothetical protein J5590_06445 [Clostridia bacterium]|nr:hypothetical protein [Clostridia bacterium]